MDETKILLSEKEMPTQWYNIQADFKQPLPPVMHPGTKKPIGPEDLAPLFPMELIKQEHDDGKIVYYSHGGVDYVESPNGVILREPVFNNDGKLNSFTVILPEEGSRRVKVYDNDWTTITAPDGTKLIYKNNVLVAVNASSRLLMYQPSAMIPSSISLDISNDPLALNYIEGVNGNLTELLVTKRGN